MRTRKASTRGSGASRRHDSERRTTPHPTRPRGAVVVGLLSVLRVATAGAQAPDLPSLDDLPPRWSTLEPGGATRCALDDPYRFYVRPGDPARLFVYFEGGGACWSGDTCDPEREDPVYIAGMDAARHPAQRTGVFDLDHAGNPLAEFSMVFAPYCTGDVHLGDRATTYRVGDREFTLQHRGHANATAVLDWVTRNFPAPRTVVVAGTSAGGVATPFEAGRLALAYPSARVVGIGDAAGAYRSDAMTGIDPAVWGLGEVFARTRGWEDAPADRVGIDGLFRRAGGVAPNLTLFQVDQARDGVQASYLELAGTADPDVQTLLRRDRADLETALPDFAGFTIGGPEHGVLGLPPLYFYQESGQRFVAWLASIVEGRSVESVSCRDCERASLAFSPADLELLDRTLELLSGPEGWDPAQPESAVCPAGAPRVSVWCALVAASRELGGPGPLDYAATWEVAYEAMVQLGDTRFRQPLTRYNNDPSTDFDDVRDLLRRAREAVVSELGGGAARTPPSGRDALRWRGGRAAAPTATRPAGRHPRAG